VFEGSLTTQLILKIETQKYQIHLKHKIKSAAKLYTKVKNENNNTPLKALLFSHVQRNIS